MKQPPSHSAPDSSKTTTPIACIGKIQSSIASILPKKESREEQKEQEIIQLVQSLCEEAQELQAQHFNSESTEIFLSQFTRLPGSFQERQALLQRHYPKLSPTYEALSQKLPPQIQERLWDEYIAPLMAQSQIFPPYTMIQESIKKRLFTWIGWNLPKKHEQLLKACQDSTWFSFYYLQEKQDPWELTTLFSNLSHIEMLEIMNENVFYYDAQNLKIIFTSLKNLKKVMFNISLLDHPRSSPEKIHILLNACSNVESIELHLESSRRINPDKVRDFLACFPRLRYIKCFWNELGTIPWEFMGSLSEVFPNLESFEVDRGYLEEIPKKDLKQMESQVWNLKAFSYASTSYYNQKTASIMQKVIQQAHQLRYLEIWGSNLSWDSHEEITKFFQSFPHLRYLVIWDFLDLPQDALRAYGLGCQHLYSLKIRSIWFTSFRPEDWQSLFSPMKALRSLTLDNSIKVGGGAKHRSTDFDPQQLPEVFSHIGKIEHLSLRECNLENISTEILTQAFAKLPNLKSLTISPETAQYFFDHIPHLKEKIVVK